MKHFIKSTLRRFGFDLVRYDSSELAGFPDIAEAQKKIILAVRPYTMTSVERIVAVINSVDYLTANKIPGDIAECGVWRGGSMMAIARTLLAHGDTSRSLYLYDTFEGMSTPTDADKSFDGTSAEAQLNQETQGTGVWCYARLEDVRENVLSTGYPSEKVHLIKGKVEDTIPGSLPNHLALLRLDTDWYESTKHELVHLFPVLDAKGILIVDDYGHWQGARKAIDEYFCERRQHPFLHRIDYTGRMMVGKPSVLPEQD